MDPLLVKKLKGEIKSGGLAKCPTCQLAFLTIDGIKNHINKGCKGYLRLEDFVSCNYCSNKFSRLSSAVAHKLKAHYGESLDESVQSSEVNEGGWTINGQYSSAPNQSSKDSVKSIQNSKVNLFGSTKDTQARGWTINGQYIGSKASCKSPIVYNKGEVRNETIVVENLVVQDGFKCCSVQGCKIKTTRTVGWKDHKTKFICRTHSREEDRPGFKADKSSAPAQLVSSPEEPYQYHRVKRIKLVSKISSEFEEYQDINYDNFCVFNGDNGLKEIEDKDPLSIEDSDIKDSEVEDSEVEDSEVVPNNIKQEIDIYHNNLKVIEQEEENLKLDIENIQHRGIEDFKIRQKVDLENTDLKVEERRDIADNDIDVKEEILCDTSNIQIKEINVTTKEIKRANVNEKNDPYAIENLYLLMMIMFCFLMLWRNLHFR